MAFAFFAENFPGWRLIAIGGPLALLWSLGCLSFAGYLKRVRGLKTGYTRKTFHFLIFMSVVVIHSLSGTRAVCLFGSMTTLMIFYAVYRGSGNLLYEAMAREKDEPHRTYFIIIPYFATLIGGLSSNMLFGQAAVVGYLTAGLGDAVGEPVGTRFGRHTYRVPSVKGVTSRRSIEGSAAILVTCLLAFTAGIILRPRLQLSTGSIVFIPLAGILCAITEAISPHGWDNIPMQLVPSCLAWMLFSPG